MEQYMKKRIFQKAVLVIVVLAIFISSFSVLALASGSFEDAVESIDKSLDYKTRRERADLALLIYGSLTDEEKEAVADGFATLGQELDALSEIEARADAFIQYVGQFPDIHDLDQKLAAISTARRDDVIFTDVTYPGIADALSALEDFKGEVLPLVENCNSFIAAVDLALSFDEDEYLEIAMALADAERYRDLGLDNTYDGISGAIASYNELSSKITTKELYTEEFLRAVEDLAGKTDYKSFSAAYEYAVDYTKNESFLPTYPGVSEALESLKSAEETMKEAIKRANAFVQYVNSLGSTGNIALELIESYDRLSGVDFTIDTAASAKAILDGAIADYNTRVSLANSDFSYI